MPFSPGAPSGPGSPGSPFSPYNEKQTTILTGNIDIEMNQMRTVLYQWNSPVETYWWTRGPRWSFFSLQRNRLEMLNRLMYFISICVAIFARRTCATFQTVIMQWTSFYSAIDQSQLKMPIQIKVPVILPVRRWYAFGLLLNVKLISWSK